MNVSNFVQALEHFIDLAQVHYVNCCFTLSLLVLVFVSEWWGAGVVICLERGADLHMAQLMPLPLTVSCFSKIQIGFTFLIPAYPSSPGQRALKRVCVCVCVLVFNGKFS